MKSPESPRSHLTKRQKQELDNKARLAKDRRKAIRWIAGAIAVGLGLTTASQTGILEPLFKEKLTGDVNQTKNLLYKWDEELKYNPQEREKYLRQSRDLAIAYFSRQMGYEPQSFQNRVELLGRKEFFEKYTDNTCNQETEFVPAFINVLDDKAFINKDDKGFAQSSDNLKRVFFATTHELFHLAPPRKHYAEPIRALKIPKPVTYEKGLAAYSLPDSNSECLTVYRTFLEEAVVDDATLRLIFPLSFNVPTGHGNLSQIYRQEVLKLYGGNHGELLGYHQRSDAEGFFRSIGEKIGGPGVMDASTLGSDYLVRYFQGAR